MLFLCYDISGDSMKRVIFHIDVNNAFLSWTAVDLLKKNHFDIRNIESVIGGHKDTRNGIVLAKSDKAKKCNIITGETIYQALRKCPKLKVYPPNYELYSEMSNKLFSYFEKYTPDLEIFSIDECFIDYTPVKKLYGNELDFALKIQKEIFNQLGFTVNIGIGNNKLCAKMASNLEKPNKINTIYDNEIENKLYPLNISDLFGVGKKTNLLLKKIGIYQIADLANYEETKLRKYFKNRSQSLIDMAKGIDYSLVEVNNNCNKCISSSKTFDQDYDDEKFLIDQLFQLTEKVAYQLRMQKQLAYVIGITIKDAFFKTTNHQKKLKNATDETKEIKQIVKKLFLEKWNHQAVRLLGVRVDQLIFSDHYQMSLFEDINQLQKNKKLNQTIDHLYQKYGEKVIKK